MIIMKFVIFLFVVQHLIWYILNLSLDQLTNYSPWLRNLAVEMDRDFDKKADKLMKWYKQQKR